MIRIWAFSWQPTEQSSETSSSVADKVQPVIDPEQSIPKETFHGFIRKSAHFLEFALLGFETMLFTYLISHRRISSWLFLPLFWVLLTATLDEFFQSFNERGSAVRDVLLDFSGGVTGIVLMLCCISVVLLIGSSARKKKMAQIAAK